MLGVLIIAAILTVFLVKNRLSKKYELLLYLDSKKYLYFIPFVLLGTINLCFGISMHYDLQSECFLSVLRGLCYK